MRISSGNFPHEKLMQKTHQVCGCWHNWQKLYIKKHKAQLVCHCPARVYAKKKILSFANRAP